jgi:hypothetical protein
MNTILTLSTILLATIAGGALALALDWLMLCAAFELMRPATAKRVPLKQAAAPRAAHVPVIGSGAGQLATQR